MKVTDAVMEAGDAAHIVAELLEAGCQCGGSGLGAQVSDDEAPYGQPYARSRAVCEQYEARVTGGHKAPDIACDDFEIGVGDWKNAILEAVEEANRILRRCIEVRVYWLPREEALKLPGTVKLANRPPPDVPVLRIVEIPGVEYGLTEARTLGTHAGCPGIEIVKLESKGRRRKRVLQTHRGWGTGNTS
ncbi:hypothetical protein [Hyperthermus butylicus]|uniref:Metal-dependent hydrolase n=1 Tax=Hyperthermus butylicus (strain DSM 5456 / JCM 9403 / PLM1-5) TaxID=415426 RepID=A2BKJ4_HYPBU|nr:hypothetical protein [Hyperthermus butylicus]ABM80505.1 Metal-dependent hydrolase [Hyperthermus butylicus DSM 5456]